MSEFSWHNSVSLCRALFCIPRPNLSGTPCTSWFPTFAFQSPMMKRTTFFFLLVFESLVGLHTIIQLQLLLHSWLEHHFSSAAWLHTVLWQPMDCSMPGFPVRHQHLVLAQTHVHQVADAIQPSHHLSSHSPPSFNLSQHQGLFQRVSLSLQVAKVLEFQLQHQSFQWIFRTDSLQDWLVWYPCSPMDSQESSPTPQFKSINSLALSFLYGPVLTSIHDFLKTHSFD